MLLLDTHAFVWLASDLDRLPERAKAAVTDNAGALYVSGIMGLEVGLAVKRGRLELPLAPEEFIAEAKRQHGIGEIPVTGAIGCMAASLPDVHNDPFDRILIATARLHGAVILSKDAMFPRYPEVRTVWA